MRSTEIIRNIATETNQNNLTTLTEQIVCSEKRALVTTTLSEDPHDFSTTPFINGFMVNTDGEYKIELIDDIVDGNYITPYLLKGVYYPYQLAKVWATGSPSSAKITGYIWKWLFLDTSESWICFSCLV